jgi:hypothetical protein
MRRALTVLVLAVLVQAPTAAGWSWPVDGPVIRPFVLGSDPYAAGQHRGIDIGAAHGTTVRAATDGSVSFVGTVPAGGRAVTIRTADGLSVTYLELGATQVERGADVAEGDPIGTIGPASHVHLGVRVTADAQGYLDPLRFLPARMTGAARADSVPGPAAAVAEAEPVADAGERAEPPAAEATATPKPASEPLVTAQGTPAASPPPTPGPAATDVAHVPLTAAQTPVATTAESIEASRDRPRSSADRAERSDVNATRPPDRVRDARASHRGRPSRAGPPQESRRRGAARPPRRNADAPPRAATTTTGMEPKVATPRAGKAPAIESPRPGSRPERVRSFARSLLPMVVFALLLLLSLAGTVIWARHRRRRGSSTRPRPVEACSVGRMRPPRLIHACVRAGEPDWPATAIRSRALVAVHRPLPRPRRRVPVEMRG